MTTTNTKLDYAAILEEASAAGKKAAAEAIPQPMVVYEADGLTDRPKPGGNAWFVSEGPCGFAWVDGVSGNSAFGRWLKKNRFDMTHAESTAHGGRWDKGYPTGYQLWVWEGGQSMARKQAYARAYADVLRSYGLKVYTGSRMD